MLFQELLHLHSGHAATACRRDSLSIPPVLHIAARVHAVNTGKHIIVRLEVSLRVHVELSGKHLGIGLVANAQEQCAGGEVPDFSGLQVLQFQASHFLLVRVIHVLYDRIEQELDLLVLLRTLQHYLRGAKLSRR